MAVGDQGSVRFSLTGPLPIIQVQAKFDTLVIGNVGPAVDLRNVREIGFSVPRTPGTFNLTVYAIDSAGCTSTTTAPRPVQVH